MTELDNAVLRQLGGQTAAVTYSYLTAVLPQWTFDEISQAVYNLSLAEKVTVDGEGIRLAETHSIQPEAQKANSLRRAYFEQDKLIGGERSIEPTSCVRLTREEAAALIKKDQIELNDYCHSHNETIECADNQRHKGQPRIEQNVTLLAFANMDTDIDELGFPVRTRRTLKRNGLRKVSEIVQGLSNPAQIVGISKKTISEIALYLEANACHRVKPLSGAQLEALQCLANSTEFYFDAFGTLTSVKSKSAADTTPPPPIASGANVESPSYAFVSESCTTAIPISELGIPGAVSRCFMRNKIFTLGEILERTDEQLLELPGIGEKKIKAVRAAIDGLLSSSQALSALSSCVQPDYQAYERYVDRYSKKAVRLIKKCIRKMPMHGLKPYAEAMSVVFLPEADRLLAAAGKDRSAAEELLIDSIISSPEAADARISLLNSHVRAAKATEENERVQQNIIIPPGKHWENAAREVAQQHIGCSYVASRKRLEFSHPSLREWVKNLPKRERNLLRLRLRGATLEECAKKNRVSKARIGQIINKTLNGRPLLKEDKYRSFYQTYDISTPEFAQLTKLNPKAARFLEITTKRSERLRVPLQKALHDDEIPTSIKKRVWLHINRDFIFIDGERVHKDRRTIALHLASKITAHHDATMRELFDAYSDFLENYAPQSKGLAFSSEHAFAEWVKRNVKEILNVPKANRGASYIRYYDTDNYDFTKLEALFSSEQFDNIECSAALVFRHPDAQEIMQELDIHDEYELHYIAKNYCAIPHGVSFKRTPTIVFGEGDRNKQVLELIQDNGPIDAFALSELYSQRYGVAPETFRGSYLDKFGIYKSHGRYSCSFEEMTGNQLDTLSELLSRDYQPLPLVKIQFEDRHPDSPATLVNASNLEKIGFRASHNLIIRRELSEADLFEGLIAENRAFSVETQGFFLDVFKHPVFRSILQSRINAMDVIEYEKDKYIHFSAIAEALDGKLSRNDLKNFVDRALESVDDNVPFTMHSLRNQGFCHPAEKLIFEVGFGDELLESLIATASIGGRVKRTSINDNYVFCKTSFSFTAVDLLEYVVAELKYADIDDLCYSIHNQYGIELNKALARQIAKRSGLYFHEDLDMVFESNDEYDRKVNEWIC